MGGGSTNSLFSEADDVSNPVSPYAATKKSCELIGYTYNHLYALPVAGLRFFTVYGPGGRPDMAPFKFIDRISRGAEIQPFGYQVYNLGNGEPTRLRDFIEIVQRNLKRQA